MARKYLPINLGRTINAETTLIVTRYILDHDSNPLPQANIDTLVYTLYERSTGTVINARQDVDGLPLVDAAGLLTLELLPADTVMVTDTPEEIHVILIEWTYNGGTRSGKGELIFKARAVTQGTP